MEVVTLILISTVALCFLAYLWIKQQSQRMPPQIPKLAENKMSFADTTGGGDIYSIFKWGPLRQISLNSHHAAREALLEQADVFSGRMKGVVMDLLFHDGGIAATDGPKWQEHRRFVMRLMRDFGMGRPHMETIITEETAAVIEIMEQAQGGPLTSQEIFSSLTSNVIARLIFGERTGTNDEQFKDFCKHLKESVKPKPIVAVLVVFPFLAKIPGFLNFFDRFVNMFRIQDSMHDYIRGKVAQQARVLSSLDEPLTDVSQANNVCEAYLIEQARQEAANPGQHTFTEWQVIRTMSDLFAGGTDTTASTLNWAMLLLAVHPDIQTRVQAEIKDKIGRARVPKFADRHSLPYVCAVMDEVMRLGTITPLSGQRRVLRDTEVLGYRLPKDCIVWLNMWGIHTNPKYWAKPRQMYPEHFLTPDGEYQPSQYLLTFSMGKRACPGESLARMEFFLILVSVMQSFSVRLADPNVDTEKLMQGIPSFIRQPLPHQVCFDRLEE